MTLHDLSLLLPVCAGRETGSRKLMRRTAELAERRAPLLYRTITQVWRPRSSRGERYLQYRRVPLASGDGNVNR